MGTLPWGCGDSCSPWFSPVAQVHAGAEAHSGVQPGGHGQLGGLRSHAEQSDDQGQHRSCRGVGGAQGVIWSK